MDGEAESIEEGTIGLDPNKTILWAQVREGQPQMSIDIEGRLRPAGIKGNSTVYLGDVARAALRSLGPAVHHFSKQNLVMMNRGGDFQPQQEMFLWL